MNNSRSATAAVRRFAVVLMGLTVALRAQTPAPPLQVERLGATEFRVTWTNTGGLYTVEQAPDLGPLASWQPVGLAPALAGNQYALALQAASSRQFFRLRSDERLTRIESTSPVAGETGVAVTRETIVRLDHALAPVVVLGPNDLSAAFGTRQILSRRDVSSDRRTLTLFYQEPLPAGARVRVTLAGDRLLDEFGLAPDLDGDGVPGGTRILEFDTLGITPVEGTAVVGRVFASELFPGGGTTNFVNHPLAGVRITVDGAEQTLFTSTDAQGNFRLEPCPAGRFFVHVDGRTSPESQWPGGDYYPVVGKAWEAGPGRTDNLAGGNGEVYLPRVVAGTLRTISPTVETVVTFPAEVIAQHPDLAGVTVTVPPNALFADQGTRGGRVGIAPVPPDRLPEPLPPGLNFPLVITVQTDGPLNFDRPVPIRFPNLPDPVTGVKLPPGAQSALWAFNHDTGRWEIQGPMTVSADGNFVDPDPGVGVRQPGWVGSQPGTSGGGGQPLPPRPRPDPDDECDEEVELAAAELFLEGIAAGMRAFSGSGNYAGDALDHFVNGNGEPQQYGPGSGPSEDLRNSQSVRDALPEIEQGLRAAVDRAVELNPDFPTTPNFETPTLGLNLYGEGNHQLRYTFGNTSGSDVDARLQDILITRNPDGSYDYVATLDYTLSENYRGNANDDSTIDGLLPYLQRCGEATPFDVSIQFQTQLRGTLPAPTPPPKPSAHPQPPPPQLRGPNLPVNVAVTTAVEMGSRLLMLHPDGSSVLAPARGTMSGRFEYLIEDYETGEAVLRDSKQGGGPIVEPTILAPLRRFRVRALHRETLATGEAVFATPQSGWTFQIPALAFRSVATDPDTDGDGLSDVAERILGTAPDAADSDGDGLRDGAEVQQGSDPLDNIQVRTGVIASAPTPASAVDVAAFNDLIAVACGPAGVALFNVFNGMHPVQVAQLDTPGNAQAVACSGNLIAVADGLPGLSVILATDTGTTLLPPVNLGGDVTEVAVAGRAAYAVVGTDLVLVDMPSGAVLDRRAYPTRGRIHDLSIAGDSVYLVASAGVLDHTVFKLPRENVLLDATATFDITDHPTFGRLHLVAGGGLVYLGALDESNVRQIPGVGILREQGSIFEWAGQPSPITAFDVEANGSGLAIFTGADPGLLSNPRVGVLDVRDPTRTDRFVTSFETPGRAQAVSVFNGRAYVADGEAGLQVVNYLADDTAGVAPQVTLQTSFSLSPAEVSEGVQARVSAAVSDDVQVRNVEFFVDGARVATDGSFPFEHFLVTPSRAGGRTEFRLRARATDTGGNGAWSEEAVVSLLPKGLSSDVRLFSPAAGAALPNVRSVIVLFDGPIDPASVSPGSLTLSRAGGGPVLPGSLVYRSEFDLLLLQFADDLPVGSYEAQLAGSLRDLAGQPITGGQAWSFQTTATSVPQVTGVTPPANAVEDQVASVRIAFSEAVAPASLNASSVQLIEAGADDQFDTGDDRVVGGAAFRFGSGEREVFLDFAGGLGQGRYRARVGSTVTDTMGTPLTPDFVWTFEVRDLFAPRVAVVSPAGGSALADEPSTIEVYFSERMDPATLTTSTLTLVQSGADGVLGTVDDAPVTVPSLEYDPVLHRVTLRLAAALGPQTYQARVSPEVVDLTGNQLGTEYRWRFKVLARTTVTGRLQLEDGTPVTNSLVRGTGFGPLTDVTDGRFATPELRLDPTVRIQVTAQTRQGGPLRVGTVRGLAPVHRGITDAGVLVLRDTCEPRFAQGLFPRNGPPGPVKTFAVYDDGAGPAVYAGVDSLFPPERNGGVYRWTGEVWETVGGPFADEFFPPVVDALVVFDDGTGPALFAAGTFNNVGGVACHSVAKWDGTRWTPLGSGLTEPPFSGRVHALAVYDDGTGPALFAGGEFTLAGGEAARNIAKWSGTAWTPLAEGIRPGTVGVDVVHALAVFDDGADEALAVGGTFGLAGQTSVLNIARWNGVDWSALGAGLDQTVRALAAFDDGTELALFAGGQFTQSDTTPLNGIGRWNGTAWSDLDGGVSGGGTSTAVLALGIHDDGTGPVLVAGGQFNRAGDLESQFFGSLNLARWNGSGWSSLRGGADTNVGLSGTVQAVASVATGGNPSLWVGGRLGFALTSDRTVPVEDAARWDDDGWHPVGGGLQGGVNALAAFNAAGTNALYAAGLFQYAGVRAANGIARWNGRVFEPLGSGLSQGQFGGLASGEGRSLAAFNDGHGPALFVGGRFDQAGDVPATNIARWTGTAWQPVGTGLADGFGAGDVRALTVFDDGNGPALYGGGQFLRAGATPVDRVARWDGTAWFPLGAGLNGTVNALVSFDDGAAPGLYAAGSFSRSGTGGPFLSRVARWDGAQWTPLGPGFNGEVHALAVHDDTTGPALYAGGIFDRAGDGSVLFDGVARWDGVSWSPVGSLNTSGFARISALTSFDDGAGPALFAGGEFVVAGPPVYTHLAVWDGVAWRSVGGGANGRVFALTAFDDGTAQALFVGGQFTGAGQAMVSRYLARWYRPVPPCP